MRFSAASALLILVVSWPVSAADPDNPVDPTWQSPDSDLGVPDITPVVEVEGTIHDGRQCEVEVTALSTVDAQNALAIGFLNHWVEVSADTPTTVTMGCHISIPILDVPPGYSCSISGAEHTGFFDLEAGVEAEVTVEHLWDFAREPALVGQAVRVAGAYLEEYSIKASDSLDRSHGAWSPCRARPLHLNIRTTISATNSDDRDAAGFITHDMATLGMMVCRPC
jgi:hypothetical protein